ncbi:serine threonine- phosphatase 6 regulatory ankyrin repeat subunit A-like isoform X4 [Paramuricea clavata]|uniref:Serine threonine- phosphatase 6 regulatory ankyrin repeat subunit A-like isoform X4 n=1 Tax=Paramuricea clavata TaxID=317549 RepID=A0A7D9DIP3_PARCT|nr:serine threonine- phosphatase 6 regulatory ankyrin repeat subunit A-like isoform X4 [Paramuricea clavata]
MLLEATKQGRIFMVNYLLDTKGVNINETDNEGQTPLINACLLDDNMAATRRKLTRLFLAKNADVNLADKSGRNVLMWACHLGKIDVVKILFGRSLMDLDFTCTDRVGDTALHYVSSSGQYTLTGMLVEAMKRFGVSLDTRNHDGLTPLLAATKNGKEMCARILLETGASPDIVDPHTLMNVKELAENGKLQSLVEQISIRNPTTQSRCTFPRQPDDDDMRSAIGSREGSVTPRTTSKPAVNQSVAGVNRPKETRSPLLSKRREKKVRLESSKNSTKKNFGSLLDIEHRNPIDFPRTPSPRPISECSSLAPASPRTQTKSPYNLRDLGSVLSLYGEQQASTFRKGFSTPVMSTEEFQDYLEEMNPKPQSNRSHRSSLTRSSTSSVGLSPLLQQRRRSVLLKEYNLHGSSDDPSSNDRRHTISHSTTSRRKDKPLVRNLSDPLMHLKLPAKTNKTSNLRRYSLMSSTQLY